MLTGAGICLAGGATNHSHGLRGEGSLHCWQLDAAIWGGRRRNTVLRDNMSLHLPIATAASRKVDAERFVLDMRWTSRLPRKRICIGNAEGGGHARLRCHQQRVTLEHCSVL